MNRDRFPGLAGGWARLDGPAGTQMVDSAIEAMAAFMRSGDNANHGGVFAAAHATDACVEAARDAVARLLGAEPAGVAFGPSMTAMTMRLSAAVGRTLAPGDEVVVTRLDHDANVRPWVIAAERAGATVRWAEPDRDTLALPASAVEAVLSERTRWVAVTAASNATGTVPELDGIVAAVARRRRADLDRRRRGRAAPGALARRARGRHARLLRLQVVRPAHRHPLRRSRPARGARARQARALAGGGAGPLRARDAAVRVARRRHRGGGVHARGRLRRDPRARGAAVRDRRRRARRDRRRDALRRPARPRPDAHVQPRRPHLGRGRDRARRARGRGLGRQLLRLRARALPRPRSARRGPRRVRALQRRGRRAAAGRGGRGGRRRRARSRVAETSADPPA